MSGADIHDATAALMYGERFTDEQRTISKRATFGTIYGGGAHALASQTGVPEDTARQVISRWRRTYPRVIAYGKQLATLAEVVTASGRRIPADPARPYANANYAVQSTARDLLLAAVYQLVTRYDVGGLWLFVHDEIIVQAPEHDAERVRGLLQRAMTGTFRGLPIVADAKILGPSWGQHDLTAAPAPRGNGTSGTSGTCAGQDGSTRFRAAAGVPEPPEPSPPQTPAAASAGQAGTSARRPARPADTRWSCLRRAGCWAAARQPVRQPLPRGQIRPRRRPAALPRASRRAPGPGRCGAPRAGRAGPGVPGASQISPLPRRHPAESSPPTIRRRMQ